MFYYPNISKFHEVRVSHCGEEIVKEQGMQYVPSIDLLIRGKQWRCEMDRAPPLIPRPQGDSLGAGS